MCFWILVQCHLEILELAAGMVLLGLGDRAYMPSHVASALKVPELQMRGEGKCRLMQGSEFWYLLTTWVEKYYHLVVGSKHKMENGAIVTSCENLYFPELCIFFLNHFVLLLFPSDSFSCTLTHLLMSSRAGRHLWALGKL